MTTDLIMTHGRTRRNLAKEGYALSESRWARNLFYIHKPDGTRYQVDLERGTCNCPARIPICAHIVFVERCLSYVRHQERRRIMAQQKRRMRGQRRLQAWARIANRTTTLAAPTTTPDPGHVALIAARRAYLAYLAARDAHASNGEQIMLSEAVDAAIEWAAYKMAVPVVEVMAAVQELRGPLAGVVARGEGVGAVERRAA